MEKHKKVIVLGATGFIGRNVIERLALREDIKLYGTYFERDPYKIEGVSFIKADLRSEIEVKSALDGMDVVIQAAANTSGVKDIVSKPYMHVTDNAVMNSLIFRAAHDLSIGQVIFFSCSIMYQPSDLPVKEEDFNPNSEMVKNYFGAGWTKIYLEKMCEFYSRLGKTKYTVLRHSNIYGPHDKFDLDKSHVFGAIMTKVLNAKEGKITVWGTGEEERDLLYVDDICDAVILSLDKQQDAFRLYNIGLGKSIPVRDLVKKIIEASGKDIKVEYDTTKPTIKTKLSLDYTKAYQELNWKPKTSLEEGIRKTMRWYMLNILLQ